MYNLKNYFTYKKKNIVLLYATLLFLVVVYYFAIHKTILAYNENRMLKNQSENSKKSPMILKDLDLSIEDLNDKLGINNAINNSNREYVLSKIALLCQQYSLKLINYPQSVYTNYNDYVIESKSIELIGNFKNITQVVFAIEKELHLGRVASLQYFIKKNNTTKKNTLVAKIIIQNISNNK